MTTKRPSANQSQWLEFETSAGRRIQVLHRVHPQARRLSITMGVEGPRLTVPRFVRAHEVYKFLHESSHWIEEKIRELASHGTGLAPPHVGANDTIVWRGQNLCVEWREARFPKAWVHNNEAVIVALDTAHPQAPTLASGAMRGLLMAEMRREVTRISREVCDKLNDAPTATRILPLKSIWGSMSYAGRMTLDLSLILAPPRALEYVIEHELCHLKHKNHSRRFWQQVQTLDPDYTTPRDWLTEHGHAVKTELIRWLNVVR